MGEGLLDGAAETWSRAKGVGDAAADTALDRALHCLVLGLAEMTVAARDPRWREVAMRLAPNPGPSTTLAADTRVTPLGAVLANSFLMHARLADDSYELAVHPGTIVVPTALAVGEPEGHAAEEVLRALLVGYEAAGVMADALLPLSAERGWRTAAIVGPVAAACVAAYLCKLDDVEATAAVRIAAANLGAALATGAEDGDDWRLQPALGAATGLHAFAAARGGLRGTLGIFEADEGPWKLICGASWPGVEPRTEERIFSVTFKRHEVPMYAQAVVAAFENARPTAGEVRRMTVHVPPFSADYANQREKPRPDAIANIPTIALEALATYHPEATPPDWEAVTVAADPSVGGLAARIVLEVDGSEVTFEGDGDTSSWGKEEFAARCAELLGDSALPALSRVRDFRTHGSVRLLLDAWKESILEMEGQT